MTGPGVGARLELVAFGEHDPYTNLRPGARGTVTFVDSLGTLHVAWDDGGRLGLLPGVDHYRELEAGAG